MYIKSSRYLQFPIYIYIYVYCYSVHRMIPANFFRSSSGSPLTAFRCQLVKSHLPNRCKKNERSTGSLRRVLLLVRPQVTRGFSSLMFDTTRVKARPLSLRYRISQKSVSTHRTAVPRRLLLRLRSRDIIIRPLRRVDRFFSSRLAIAFYTTTRGAMPRLAVLVRDDVLGLSHFVVMPHLVGCAPPPSPGARIGAGIEFWVVGTAVVVC